MTRFYGVFAVLRGVSFALPAGCLVKLLGPNGAGKSTLLNILAGGLRASSGSIAIAGAAVRTPAACRLTGMLAHQSLLHPTLTVRENLEFYATLYDLPTGAVDEALDLVGAEPLAARRVGELSQGMRQRAALARAVLHRPRLLLLDEPFASLDKATVAALRQALARLRANGLTLLVSTHTDEIVGDLVDGALHLERGRLVDAEGVAASAAVLPAARRNGPSTLSPDVSAATPHAEER